MHTETDIINRIDEQRYLLNFFKSKSQEKKILILYSRPGIGKSYLVDRVISQLQNKTHYATIGKATKYDGATYIQQIADALNELAKMTGCFPTLSQFRNLLTPKDIDSTFGFIGGAVEPIGQIATSASTPGSITKAFGALRGFLSYFAATETPDEDVVKTNDFDAIKLCEQYARYIVSRNDLILRINRYNDIDEESDFYLRNLYGGSKNLTLILEITQNDECYDSATIHSHINDRFLEGYIDSRIIDKVDVKHVVEHFEQTLLDELFNVPAFVEDAFVSSGGDFKRFQFLLREKRARPMSEDLASAEEHITSLIKGMSVCCKRFLALVTATPTQMRLQSIREIWSTNNWSIIGDLPSTIEQLRAQYGSIISVESDPPILAAEFARDFILRCSELRPFHVEARRVVLAQLRHENLSGNAGDRAYSNLLCIISIIIQGEGSADTSLLPSSLRELDLNQYPRNKVELAIKLKELFFQYVHKGRQSVTEDRYAHGFDAVYEEICKILYRIGATELLEEIANSYSRFFPIEKQNDCLRLTIICAKILNCRIDAINDLEAIDKSNLQLYIGSRFLLVLYYRTFGFLRKAKWEWKRLKKEADAGDIPFQSLLFEYKALTHPINIVARIRALKKAKACHLANGNEFHTVTCSLAIAGTYSHIPLFHGFRLKLTREELASTSRLLPNVRVMDHILENNATIAQIQSNGFQSGAVEKLTYAYDRCALQADKLLIGANLINCYIEARRRQISVDGISAYVKDVLSIGRIYLNRNGEFSMYALSACYRYFKFMDDRQTSREMELFDLANMPIQLSFYNFGHPQTIITRSFVRWVYSKVYIALWPKVQPVFSWSTDFYSFQSSS